MTRYPNYDVLKKWSSPDWDAQTRSAVRRRLAEVPPIRFLTDVEAALLEVVVDRIIPQPDRSSSDKVPIVPWIDEKLHNDWRDGYRYQDMPPQRDAWRLGLAGIDESARLLYGRRNFVDLEAHEQDEVLRRIARGEAPGFIWERLSAKCFFRDVLSITVVKIYYAHPRAWSEIGYSGPSSPRGHVRNGMGGVDPWDAPDEQSS
ncbi:MAG: gluconate 2-dehydrogenase subunit 3 family protein [Gemmatimonadaceae bacterium]